MALNPNEQFTNTDGVGGGLRVWPAEDGVRVAKLTPGTGTLARLTPLAYNTSTNSWSVYDADGSNGTDAIGCFLYDDEAVLDSDEEILAQVIFAGTIHFDDIPIVSGYVLADLQTQVRTLLRTKGFQFQGITQFR